MNIKDELALGMIKWYPFGTDKRVLCIDCPDVVVSYLCADTASQGEYDYILLYGIVESYSDYKSILEKAYKDLAKDGKLLLYVDNAYSSLSLCGDRQHIGKLCQQEIKSVIKESGFGYVKFFSVFPHYTMPQLIYADGVFPNEKLVNRYIPKYDKAEEIYMHEGKLCDNLANGGRLHIYAASFFVECSKEEFRNDICSVTLTMERGHSRAVTTIVKKKLVEKHAAYRNGVSGLHQLYDNMEYLVNRGVDVVECKKSDDGIIMPYVNYELANSFLQRLLREDEMAFRSAIDKFYELIVKSSEIIDNTDLGPILKKGFIDLVPLNCFWNGKDYIVFDQEYVDENIPANLMMLRSLIIIYDGVESDKVLVSRQELFVKYGIDKCLGDLLSMERKFINSLKGDKESADYLLHHQLLPNDIYDNFMRMSAEERADGIMDKSFKDAFIDECRVHCFDNTKNTDVFVWGSGAWADMFMNFYKNDVNIVGVIDNNYEKQGTTFYGYPVLPYFALIDRKRPFKVIVCVKKCEDIIQQLLAIGINSIGIFDAHYIYPGRKGIVLEREIITPKKYHVGYISGVFDLYHIGHINMFKRAKELCDYLIVAVTSDEYVRNHKNREPFIPVEERVECVKSCKYVDEVFVTPYRYAGIVEAFQKFHYDVQFCGSDYVNNPWWLQQRDWLEAHGSHLEFFPYTESTSSTKIKELIEKGLL